MEFEIKHYPEKNKFVTEVEGQTASVEYNIYEDYLNVAHTYVPKQIGGRGIAGALVETTCRYALENGLKPQATCSYAVLWLRKHPEFME